MVISKEQRQKLEEIGSSYNLRFLIVHGSCARGVDRKGSDIDVAIVGKSSIPYADYFKLYGELSEIFEDSVAHELDLKTLHGVDSLFRYHVVRDGVLLYGDRSDYEEFRLFAYSDYQDSEDLRELQTKLLRKSMNTIAERYAQ